MVHDGSVSVSYISRVDARDLTVEVAAGEDPTALESFDLDLMVGRLDRM